MEISEIKQLQINATKARMGAIIGTYNAKSGHPVVHFLLLMF